MLVIANSIEGIDKQILANKWLRRSTRRKSEKRLRTHYIKILQTVKHKRLSKIY